MKRIIAGLLVLVLIFSVCACGEEEKPLEVGDIMETVTNFPKGYENAWKNSNGNTECYLVGQSIMFDEIESDHSNYELWLPFDIYIKEKPGEPGHYVKLNNDEIELVLKADGQLDRIIVRDKTGLNAQYNGTYMPPKQ